MRLILDTATFIWAVSAPEGLSRPMRRCPRFERRQRCARSASFVNRNRREADQREAQVWKGERYGRRRWPPTPRNVPVVTPDENVQPLRRPQGRMV